MRVRRKPFRIPIFAFRPELGGMFQCFLRSVKGFAVFAARRDCTVCFKAAKPEKKITDHMIDAVMRVLKHISAAL